MTGVLAFDVFGGPQLILILALALLFFGGKKLPSLARGLGESVKEFKKASRDADDAAKAPVEAKKPAAPSDSQGSN